MSRSILRVFVAAVAMSSFAMAACSSGGEGTTSGGPLPVASNGASSSGGIDTPDRNVICPADGGGPRCTDGGVDGAK